MNASPACTQQSTPMPSPYAWMVAAQRLQPIPLQTPMRVSLACVENRVDVSLRFGKPVRETVLDRWRRVVTFMPGAVCCRFKCTGVLRSTLVGMARPGCDPKNAAHAHAPLPEDCRPHPPAADA